MRQLDSARDYRQPAKLPRRRQGMRRARPVVELGKGLSPETLEPRTLLSGLTVQLIDDVNTAESYPKDVTAAGSNLFFETEDPSGSGRDLVVMNASGTTVLQDLSGLSGYYSNYSLTAVGNSVFFTGSSGGQNSVWTSDGTSAGTQPVSFTSGTDTYIEGTASTGNAFLFVSTTYQESVGEDYTLWAASPGATTATELEDFGDNFPSFIGQAGGVAYYSSNDDLWSTNGTAAGTQELLNSSSSPLPSATAVFGAGSTTYYVQSSQSASVIGTLTTSAETPIISDLPSTISTPVVVGSQFYFTAASDTSTTGYETQLWVSSGTQNSTAMVEDFSSISQASVPNNFLGVDGSLFFTVEGSDGLDQLWKSNGTSQGTSEVMDLDVDLSSSGYYGGSSSSGTLAAVGNTLYFPADDGTHGDELWSDNAATGTTQLVDDINPGAAGSDPTQLTTWNNQVYFAANDGTSPLTSQLWTAGGTVSGAAKAWSGSPGLTGDSADSASTRTSVVVGSELLLPLNDGVRGTALWETNGTAAGTQYLAQVDPIGMTLFDGEAYFLGTSAGGTVGLWKSNGTAAGTTEVEDLSSASGVGGAYADQGPIVSGNNIYFTTSDGDGGDDLWVSNGTASGTSVVNDFAAVSSGGYGEGTVQELTAFDGGVAFVADSGTSGKQVWFSSGTSSGTQMVSDVAVYSGKYDESYGTSPASLTAVGSTLYFVAGNANGSPGLWSSNGTARGTSEFFVFPAMPAGNSEESPSIPTAENLTAVGSLLFFSLDYYSEITGGSDQLWTTSGTASSTQQVVPADGTTFTFIASIVSLSGSAVFSADTSSGDEEVWLSDGTSAGTQELTTTGASGQSGYYGYGGNLGSPLVANGVLYFSGETSSNGNQLWETNGTAAGTFVVADINPSGSPDPVPLALLNGNLILAANDGTHGDEPMEVVSTGSEAAPQIGTLPTLNATVGEAFQFNVAPYASDPNSPVLPLSYGLGPDAPAGMTIDSTTGEITWPAANVTAAQDYTFTVTISDNESTPQSISEPVTLDVNPVQAPSLNPIDNLEVGEGQTFELNLNDYASDPNYPPLSLTYGVVSGPAGTTINSSTGIVTWAAPAGDVGQSFTFTVEVSDDSSPPLTDSETFNVEVESVSAPTFRSVPAQNVDIGQTLFVALSKYANDPNFPTLPLTYTLGSGAPTGMSIDPTNGVLLWTPGASQPTGPVSVTVNVADNSSPPLTASQTFTVNVQAAGTLLPPVLETLPGTYVTAGETLTDNLAYYASDPNTPALPLTFSLGTGAPAGVSIDPESGTLTWDVPANFALGQYTFDVIVSDNQATPATATSPITVTVDALQKPEVDSDIPTQGISIGNTLTLQLSEYSYDPNSPPLPLTYSLGSGAPAGASVDSGTGVFTWAPGSSVATGDYTISFKVTDTSSPPLSATGSFVVEVVPAGELLPPIVRTIPTEDDTVGETFSLDLSEYVSDPNTPPLPLTYSLGADAPPGATIDASTGELSWTSPSDQPLGDVTFTFEVSDNQTPAETATGQITIYVEPVQAPYVGPIPAQGVDIGQTLNLDLSSYAHDYNTVPLPLTYALGQNAPTGATLDATTGEFSWTLGNSVAPGTYTVPFTVSDDETPPDVTNGSFTVVVGQSGEIEAPVLESLPTYSITAGETYTVFLSSYASDPNTPPLPLTWSLGSGAPSGATIDPSTGELNWVVPSSQAAGYISFDVIVADNETTPQTAEQQISIDVQAPEAPLVNPEIPTTNTKIGTAVAIPLANYVSDPNYPATSLTYSLVSGAPSDAGLNPSTGLFTWTPSASDGTGTYTITFTATDSLATPLSSTGTFTIDVGSATLQPPTFSAIPAQSVTAGETLQFDAGTYASDPNSAALPLTFSLGTGAPGGATIDASTGTVTWSTSGVNPGSYSFTVIAADNESTPLTGQATFTVNVLTPVAPSIASIPTTTAGSGHTASVDLNSYVTDENTPILPVTYTLVSGPSGLTITPSSGEVTWQVPQDQPAGDVSVTFDVSDSLTSATPTQGSFTIDVSNSILSPVVSPTIPTTIITAGLPVTVSLTTYASDPNSPKLTLSYALTSTLAGNAAINPSTGAFTWTVPANQTPGDTTVDFTVSNGQSTPTPGSFELDVLAPIALSVATIPAQNVTIGQPIDVNLAPYVTDSNTPGPPLTFQLGTGAPTGATVTSAGAFSWTPSTSSGTGTFTINWTVQDGSTPPLTGNGTLTIDVLPVVNPPAFSTIAAQTITEGETLTVNAGSSATDPNTPPLPLTFSLSEQSPGGATINPGTGAITWDTAGVNPGTYSFTVIAADNESTPQTAQKTFTATVLATQAPTITAVPTQSAQPGSTVTVNLGNLAADHNTPVLPLSYTLVSGPTGATIDPTTGVFSWAVPSSQASGAQTVSFKVADSVSSSPLETFTINVSSVQPPSVQSIPGQTATIGQAFSLNVSQFASDPNSPPLPLSYSLGSGAPAGAAINPTSGVLTWTPAASQPAGNITISIIVSDNATPPNTVTSAITVDVKAAPVTPPVLQTVSSPVAGSVGQTLTFNVGSIASDSSTTALSYSLGAGAPAGVTIDASTGVLSWNLPANQQIGTYPVTVTVTAANAPSQPVSETIDLSVVDNGPAPMIASATASTKKSTLTITLTFSEAVNPATASSSANYMLTEPGKKVKSTKRKPAPTPVPIAVASSVSFNSSTNQVTITTKKPKAGTVLTLTVVGSGSGGIAKLDGLRLAGNGTAGTNYTATISGKRVTPTSAVTSNRIVVRTATPGHSLVRHRATTPDVRGRASTTSPGGPLALARPALAANLVLGVLPSENNGRNR